LDNSQGTKNVFHLFVLDGPILRHQKLLSVDPAAILSFQESIRKQLRSDYSQEAYNRKLDAWYAAHPSHELMKAGKVWPMVQGEPFDQGKLFPEGRECRHPARNGRQSEERLRATEANVLDGLEKARLVPRIPRA
jgi:hypothetical protein